VRRWQVQTGHLLTEIRSEDASDLLDDTSRPYLEAALGLTGYGDGYGYGYGSGYGYGDGSGDGYGYG
jgi:hypothetical protein